MKKFLSGLAAAAFLAASGMASAEEVDFLARLNNLDMSAPSSTKRLVGAAIFTEPTFNSEGGVKHVFFVIHHVDGENYTEVFSGEASIAPNQTQVISGNNQTGRIELTYDATLNRVEARVSLNVPGGNEYAIYIGSGSFAGTARIRSSLVL